MWYVLLVFLWGSNPDLPPDMVKPPAFTDLDKCHEAGGKLMVLLKDAKLDSVAAVTMECKPISNPLTEQHADKGI